MLAPFICALGFLTRLPVPSLALSEHDVARSSGFFAWVGLLIGGVLIAVGFASRGFGSGLSALCVITVWAYLTGALHLDGLADTVDGLSGGRGDRERALSIMRDSRIGAHGATALVLALALKTAAWMRASEVSGELLWLVPAVARFGCTLLLARFSYARAEGLGRAFAGRVGRWELLLGVSALLIPVLWLGAARSAVYAGAAIGGLSCALLVAFRVRAALGGLTGDVHGAAIEVSEIGMLLALSAIPVGLSDFGLR